MMGKKKREEAPAAVETEAPAAVETIVVAPGHSVTSQRGILGPGTVVTERDFDLTPLLECGALVRVKGKA